MDARTGVPVPWSPSEELGLAAPSSEKEVKEDSFGSPHRVPLGATTTCSVSSDIGRGGTGAPSVTMPGKQHTPNTRPTHAGRAPIAWLVTTPLSPVLPCGQ